MAWLCVAIGWAQPHQVVIHEDDAGFKIQVDGVDTMLFGMNWGHMPVGENYSYDFWGQPEDFIEQALEMHMSRLKLMGINTIRQYDVIPPKWVEWIYDNYGIYTMINPLVGRYGMEIDGTWVAQTPYGDPKARKILTDMTMASVMRYKDTRGVIMFMLGNEANYGLEWTSFEIQNLPKGDRQKAKARQLYSLYGEIVDKIQAVAPNQLVTICNGDLQYLDLIAELVPNQDLLGTNVYRGRSSTDLFERVKNELGIPVFYAEFGSDAYNAREGREDGRMQAEYFHDLWIEVFLEAYGKGGTGVAVGGYMFEWQDEWWKYKQEVDLDVHDTTASWSNQAYLLDWEEGLNNMNEEWFGINGIGLPDKRGMYSLQPRETYFMMRDIFNELERLGGIYDPSVTPGTIAQLAAFTPGMYVQDAEVAKIAVGGATQRLRVSTLRLETGTVTAGGDTRRGRGPANISTDSLQSVFLGAEARPDDSLRFEASVNVLGNVPDNYIDPIRFENRGRAGGLSTVETEQGGRENLEPLNRVQLYQASFDWKTRTFDLKGYYRTGSYHWAYEGDFFGLYPETNYGFNLDVYNGIAPVKVELTGKRWMNGLKLAAGPQVFWGANPAVFAKYVRPLGGRWTLALLHHEDIASQPIAVAQSAAVPEQLTRRTTASLYYGSMNYSSPFYFVVGGIWGGTPKIGQEYVYVQDAAGDESYLGTGYDVIRDQIRMMDTFGGKARMGGRIGSVSGFAQAAYKGLVADGGWEDWRPDTRLGESGRGNQMSAWAGLEMNIGKFMLFTSGMAQRPLVGPNPVVQGQFDPVSQVYFPGLGARNFIDDPFAVLENREMLAGEVILKWDSTPATYFYQWDNYYREDAGFAADLAFTIRHLPTVRDSNFGFLADGTLFAFGGSPPAPDQPLWDVSTRIVTNLGDTRLTIDGYAGTTQARGTDDRIVFRKGLGLLAEWRSLVVNSWVKLDDYAPVPNSAGGRSMFEAYDFHRDFNLTFPLQTYLDVSAGLSRPPLLGMSTRFGGWTKFRLLDEFSPVPFTTGGVTVNGADQGQRSPDAPPGYEFTIGTYVRLAL